MTGTALFACGSPRAPGAGLFDLTLGAAQAAPARGARSADDAR